MQGLRKSIGNGEDSLVWRDNWINDVRPRPPYGFGYGQSMGLKVRDLMDVDTQCQLCAAENESINHILFSCPFLRDKYGPWPIYLCRYLVFLKTTYM